ncbi:hypothetical protein CABS01_09935 [Colletotrichum abscissum]|uniref:BTB domain-containing protein n=1 Tax=Colletotrichum abscissum TaxID=1671311 RepID=A0A9P9XN48_9PEZI|nr:uncharacterized protein CABS01_09935 [Colletotrichum abscissum]KAI3556988.1 hypothetical protein CABS02_02995 [Colletotrichum abscissum]KAK1501200.1 hypothetical protein CABS01_09935 [Colletotrichum abscissum]
MVRPMLDMRKILNSPQIEYHVGESGKSFSVPKAVMEFLSPKLVRMPPSGQGQPNSASITLRDIDEATFTRLVEYAYRQDYTVQGLKARSFASDEVSVLPSLYDKLERGDEYSESNPFIHDSGMDFLRELKGSYIMLDKSIHKEALEAKKLPGRYVRFDTLNAHIALLNVAHTYDIHPLKDLCKAHFRECLLFMPLNRYTVADLLTVWDSVEHIADCAPGNAICNIILDYFVATLPTSRHHPRFRDTLVQDEAFTRQLLDKLPNVAPPIDD